MSQDLLYINEQLADLGDFKPKITRQRNDFAKLQEIKSDFAKISLPPTKNNKKIFEHVEVWGSTSTVPYQYLDARLYLDGEPFTPFGKLALDNIDDQGFYECVIYTGLFPLFDTLANLKMKDLDLSEYSHFLTLAEVTARNANPTDVFYPIFNDGYGINGNVSLDRLVPFIKNDVLVRKILEAQGFTVTGTFMEASELTGACTVCLGSVTSNIVNNSTPPIIDYDITQSDMIKTFMQQTNSIVTGIDYFTNNIEINTFKSITQNQPVTIELNQVMSQKFDLSGAAQRNYFNYENEDNETIGQNILSINNTRLDVESDAIDSEIKALEQSTITLDTETETVDTIYVFEDKQNVRDNLEEGDTTKYRQEINRDDLFVSLYETKNVNITYEVPELKQINDLEFEDTIRCIDLDDEDGTLYIGNTSNVINQYDITNDNVSLLDTVNIKALSLSVESNVLIVTTNSANNVYGKEFNSYDISTGLSNAVFLDDTSTEPNDVLGGISGNLIANNSMVFSTRTDLFSFVDFAIDQIDMDFGNGDFANGLNYIEATHIEDSGTYNERIEIAINIDNATINDEDNYNGILAYIAFENRLFTYNLSRSGGNSISASKIDSFKLPYTGATISYSNKILYISQVGSNTVQRYLFPKSIGTTTQSSASTTLINFSNLYWQVLNTKYYQQWLELFQEYREITILAQLTGQEINNFDFKNPVYLSNKYGSQKFLVERIENYQKGKPTKVKLLKL